ncbi:MAG: LTA synthase family protein [bacterium]
MKKAFEILVCVLCLFLITVTCIMDDHLHRRRNDRFLIEQYGMSFYLFYDIYDTFINNRTLDITQEEKKEIKNFYKNLHKKNFFKEKIEKKNIVVLQLESIDKIMIDAKYQGRYVMPNINKLMDDSIYFPNTYNQAEVGQTSDAEIMFLTSMLPLNGEVMAYQYDLTHLPSLPRILQQEGYLTTYMHGYTPDMWNRFQYLKALGFQKTYFEPNFPNGEKKGWGVSDKYMLTKVMEKIEETNELQYLHFSFLTNHAPYNYVKDSNFIKEPKNFIEHYINSVYYTDEAIGWFLSELEKKDVLKDTVLVIFADHNSSMVHRGIEENNFTVQVYNYFEKDFDNFTVREVPFLIYNGRDSFVSNRLISQVDIGTLILDMFDIKRPEIMLGLTNYKGLDGLLTNRNELIYLNENNDYEIKEIDIDMDLIIQGTLSKEVSLLEETKN